MRSIDTEIKMLVLNIPSNDSKVTGECAKGILKE